LTRSIGELLINGDVWKALSPDLQEIVRTAAHATLFQWWARWQKQNAEAIKELADKHKVEILKTPDDILIEFLKAWDRIAKREAEKGPSPAGAGGVRAPQEPLRVAHRDVAV
jgi:TRAP-type C4-dicarboxylate transport system substrate-binding protein